MSSVKMRVRWCLKWPAAGKDLSYHAYEQTLQYINRLSRGSSFNGSFSSLSMSTPDLSQPSYFRSPSPMSMTGTPDMSSNVDHKLQDLEGVLCQQKLTIKEQKEEISVHKKKIRKLERAVQHLYKEDYNLEDID